jgi:hypothetical protein
MPNTILLGHTFPSENQDPHYTTLTNFFNQNDVTMWNNRLRSWMILAGGGTLTWNSGTGSLFWTEDFVIKNLNSGFLTRYVFGTDNITREVVINDGQILYGEFSSILTTTQYKNLLVADQLGSIDNLFVLAFRYGTKLYFQNGIIL